MLLALPWLLSGCRLLHSPPATASRAPPAGEFAVYLLTARPSPRQIEGADLASLPLQPQPVLSTDDLVAYCWDSHELELVPAAYARIEHLEVPVGGLPFVVAVGREPVYSGAFWTPLSSLSYDGIVIETLRAAPGHAPRIQLGYPESPDLFRGEDRCADPRIRAALEQAGKLQPVPGATATPGAPAGCCPEDPPVASASGCPTPAPAG